MEVTSQKEGKNFEYVKTVRRSNWFCKRNKFCWFCFAEEGSLFRKDQDPEFLRKIAFWDKRKKIEWKFWETWNLLLKDLVRSEKGLPLCSDTTYTF